MRKLFDHPYRVVRYDASGDMIDELAQCVHFSLAKACMIEAVQLWPDDEIAVQHGIRIMIKQQGPVTAED